MMMTIKNGAPRFVIPSGLQSGLESVLVTYDVTITATPAEPINKEMQAALLAHLDDAREITARFLDCKLIPHIPDDLAASITSVLEAFTAARAMTVGGDASGIALLNSRLELFDRLEILGTLFNQETSNGNGN